MEYAEKLKRINKDTELHFFSHGVHGLGLAKSNEYVSEWTNMLVKWLTLNVFYSIM